MSEHRLLSPMQIPFLDNEIILRLHDGGASGRLFKTREF